MSACIIPVAPNFQDPPSVPDAPPYLFNFQPASPGNIVTIPGADVVTFSANVTDIDVGDKLYYRWVLNYPPFKDGVTKPLNAGDISPLLDGRPINMPLPQMISCTYIGRPSEGAHQLELIVADRAFSNAADLKAENLLDSLPEDSPGFVVRATWTIVASCSAVASTASGAP
jgi:hypothetical protein